MYKVEISNKNGGRKIVDCNEERNVYSALRELGINSLMQRLKVGENENGVTLKLVADNDFDAAITKILTDNRDTLYDAILAAKRLKDLNDEAIKEEIERNAVNEQYETKVDIYEDIRKMKRNGKDFEYRHNRRRRERYASALFEYRVARERLRNRG